MPQSTSWKVRGRAPANPAEQAGGWEGARPRYPHRMPLQDNSLPSRWHAALLAAGGTPRDPDPYAADLLARWAEPQRRYHDTAHLTAVLDHIDVLEQYADDAALVRLAAWFHDAVYLPDRSENEERSARLAERALPEAGLSAQATAEVARLVRLTVTHAPEDGDANGAVLCDADLAILAAAPRGVRRVRRRRTRGVRLRTGRAAFRAGRADVLRQLLALPRLFRTPHGERVWEGRGPGESRGGTGPARPIIGPSPPLAPLPPESRYPACCP